MELLSETGIIVESGRDVFGLRPYQIYHESKICILFQEISETLEAALEVPVDVQLFG